MKRKLVSISKIYLLGVKDGVILLEQVTRTKTSSGWQVSKKRISRRDLNF